jgi:hypothetical protein
MEYAIDLRIAAYQFPGCDNDDDDSDWLMIEGKITHPIGAWEFCEPCLTTWEVRALARWLTEVAKGEDATRSLIFSEPNLLFLLNRASSPSVVHIDVDFSELPDWPFQRGPLRIDVPVDPKHFIEAAESLDRQLLDYPGRATSEP